MRKNQECQTNWKYLKIIPTQEIKAKYIPHNSLFLKLDNLNSANYPYFSCIVKGMKMTIKSSR